MSTVMKSSVFDSDWRLILGSLMMTLTQVVETSAAASHSLIQHKLWLFHLKVDSPKSMKQTNTFS